jgi:hypothetical protein
MAVRVQTGSLHNLSEAQQERIQNVLLQALVRELGDKLPPDWTQITFSRIGPSHDPAEKAE